MLVDKVARAIVEVLHIGNVGQCAGRVLHAVEPLRIKPLPPLILSLCLREMAIIRNAGVRAGLVGAMRRLEPPPVARLMHRHSEA